MAELDEIVTSLDLASLRMIRTLSETGSISATATHLGLSQPAISQHLQRLTTRLGLPLTRRVGRTVQLTELGQLMARHAHLLDHQLQALAAEIAQMQQLASGSIRIASFPTASSAIIPQLFSTMAQKYPGVHPTYVEAEPPQAIDLLQRGHIDLAITFSYPEDPENPHTDLGEDYQVLNLFQEPMLLALPAGHDLIEHDNIELADLKEDLWIAGCPVCRGHLLHLCDQAGFTPTITHETDNYMAVLATVNLGLAVALVPQMSLHHVSVPAGVVLKELSPRRQRHLHAVTRYESLPTVNLVKELLSQVDPEAGYAVRNKSRKASKS